MQFPCVGVCNLLLASAPHGQGWPWNHVITELVGLQRCLSRTTRSGICNYLYHLFGGFLSDGGTPLQSSWMTMTSWLVNRWWPGDTGGICWGWVSQSRPQYWWRGQCHERKSLNISKICMYKYVCIYIYIYLYVCTTWMSLGCVRKTDFVFTAKSQRTQRKRVASLNAFENPAAMQWPAGKWNLWTQASMVPGSVEKRLGSFVAKDHGESFQRYPFSS